VQEILAVLGERKILHLAGGAWHWASQVYPADTVPLRSVNNENFVIMELRKQASWHDEQPQLYHFRTPKGIEVDLVLEFEAGEVVGIEVTRSQTVTGGDFRGLHELMRLAGKRFRAGLILYLGRKVVPFAKNLHAVPMSALWEW
jgi:predicted AAA+ superfamily ATPase